MLDMATPTDGRSVVTDATRGVRVAFLGRVEAATASADTSSQAAAEAALRHVLGDVRAMSISADSGRPSPAVSILRQVHSATVVDAADAPCEADALTTCWPDHALCIFTADCVPVLLAEPSSARIAAAHAGWRGLASGVVPAALAAFADPSAVTAWIGPSIGACCYEVSWQVALQVAQRSGMGCVLAGVRPHLDVERAALEQLLAAGVEDVRIMRACTRCSPAWHSYRGDGAGRGRNHAFIWRDSSAAASSPRSFGNPRGALP